MRSSRLATTCGLRTLLLHVYSAAVIGAQGSPPTGQQVAVPAGWTVRGTGGTQVFTAPNTDNGASYSVTVSPETPIGGAALDGWLQAQADADAIRIGMRVETRGAPNNASPTLATVSRLLRDQRGVRSIAVYFATQRSSRTARLTRVLTNRAALLQTYQRETQSIVLAPAAAVATTDVTRARGPSLPSPISAPSASTLPSAQSSNTDDVSRIRQDVAVQSPAPSRSVIRAGGVLVPGKYVGRRIRTDTRDVLADVTLWLFPNGEYRVISGEADAREHQFRYDPSTGRIDLDYGVIFTIENSTTAPNTDFAVLGRSTEGKPMLYAENDRGFHTDATILVFAGPNDRLSPTAIKRAAAAAAAEAARYKYVVAPGEGLRDADIAGIWSRFGTQQSMTSAGQLAMSTTRTLYLLLNDGTIHEDVPVAPDEIDISASRRLEPEAWGRWRRSGTDVLVAWSAAPTEWEPLDANAMVKAPVGMQLRGAFGGGDSFASGAIMSFSRSGVTFGANSAFETESSGGSGTSGAQSADGGVSVQTTRDDDGSYTSVVTPGAVGGRGTAGSGRSRRGSYRISGWTLEARYTDGRVVRQPFFFVDSQFDALYWQGDILQLNRANP